MSSGRMKILMVPMGSLTLDAGGVSTMVRSLARQLSKNHEVQIFINNWNSRNIEYITECDKTTTMKRIRPPYDGDRFARNLAAWVLEFPSTFAQLKRFIQKEGFQIIHLHFADQFHYMFRILNAVGSSPYVVTLHRGDILRYPDLPQVERALTGWSLRGAARVVAVSQWLKRLAEETIPGIGTVDCIHNGLDVDPAAGNPDAVGSADLAAHLPSRFFLIVANLAHYKGQDVAIKAWSRVRARHPDVQLLIVGEPRDHWETCENLISELGLGDVIRLLGPRSNQDVLWLMRRALGLIAPSRSEGFSMVVIEAALNGLPVIATRIEPFMEFVGDDAMGLTFPVDNAEALADIVERGLADPAAMAGAGEALRQRAETHFTSAVMAAKYEALFRDVVGGQVRAVTVPHPR